MARKRPPGPSSKPPVDGIILVVDACGNGFSPDDLVQMSTDTVRWSFYDLE